MVRAARERGAAVLFATHDVGRAVELADRALVLQRGRVVLDDPAPTPKPSGGPTTPRPPAEMPGPPAGMPQPRGGDAQIAGRKKPGRRPE